MKNGYTAEQAKLMAVWRDKTHRQHLLGHAQYDHSTGQCGGRHKTGKNSQGTQKAVLDRYAAQTCSGYCAGCADICESALDYRVPISDLLRCSMYHFAYGGPGKRPWNCLTLYLPT